MVSCPKFSRSFLLIGLRLTKSCPKLRVAALSVSPNWLYYIVGRSPSLVDVARFLAPFVEGISGLASRSHKEFIADQFRGRVVS